MAILDDIQGWADDYYDVLRQFVEGNHIEQLFIVKPDHIAVKSRHGADFDATITQLRPYWQQASYIRMHNRRLATVILKTPILVGSLGETYYLEVMEPRPEKVGVDLTGFEHIELLNDDFDNITAALDEKHIHYEPYENPGHKAIVVQIDDVGHEVKFTNTALGMIIVSQHEAGIGTSF